MSRSCPWGEGKPLPGSANHLSRGTKELESSVSDWNPGHVVGDEPRRQGMKELEQPSPLRTSSEPSSQTSSHRDA